jgi:hypothetical protein
LDLARERWSSTTSAPLERPFTTDPFSVPLQHGVRLKYDEDAIHVSTRTVAEASELRSEDGEGTFLPRRKAKLARLLPLQHPYVLTKQEPFKVLLMI